MKTQTDTSLEEEKRVKLVSKEKIGGTATIETTDKNGQKHIVGFRFSTPSLLFQE